ncbi:tetratricopeptide repeat protein [Methylobacterium planeticum]|uniref:protein O-GlcNAc transferase n=1 Tax=Methylobacterium planeticum TaxID=2615211 RepID=A0A6N6MVG3_9HYPH|nr:tetratricopeptide repeat protein [Methylobacterium planeticum]KAB1076075.1 tetratricopeptide repeat protein [Methylobacterium planeticum]
MTQQRNQRDIERSRTALPVSRSLKKAAGQKAANRLEKARRRLQALLDLTPGHVSAHFELATLAHKAGDLDEAVPHYAAALRGASDRPEYWIALATALLQARRVDDARAIIDRFMKRAFGGEAPQALLKSFANRAFAEACLSYEEKNYPGAESLLDMVIAIDETHADATFLAGAVAARMNKLDLAQNLLSIAIYREPENAQFFNGLGAFLTDIGDYGAAVSALEKAIALDPVQAVAHSNLAGALCKRGDHDLALRHAKQAIAIDPASPSGYINLGINLKSLGRLAEAVAAYERAIACDPDNVIAQSNRLFAKLYSASVAPIEYFEDARAFGRRFADPLLRRRPFANDRDPDRRLRIGFVSADLCAHAVARFLEPVLNHLDRTEFEVTAYMARGAEDAVSGRLRGVFDAWHNIAGLADDAAADLVEAHAIDVLVDLSGHSSGHRLLLFARKPAPVQATWIGHPATTGLTAIDYRITDAVHDEVGVSDAFHTETVWRLPGVSATYQAPDDVPEVRHRPPFEDRGYVTFGFLNRFEKAGDRCLETFAQILSRIPDARLFIVVGGVDAPEARADIERRLSAAGLPLDRVILRPRVTAGYFELYHEVDIALDSFPYNGGTTSCETLCMGVPFIALKGAHAAARTGIAVLTAVGLAELAAETPDDYAARAVALASDPDRLRAIRSGLRERLLASALMDHSRFAADVGEAFRAMWRRWVDASSSS